MRILHIEDYDKEKGKDYSEALKRLIDCDHIEYLSDLFDLELDYDFIIMDGQFPLKKGHEPDVMSFFEAISFLKKKGFELSKVIVWSNSTRVHAFCFENNLRYFSKKEMREEDYIKKGIDVKVIAKKASEEDIVEMLISLTKKSRS